MAAVRDKFADFLGHPAAEIRGPVQKVTTTASGSLAEQSAEKLSLTQARLAVRRTATASSGVTAASNVTGR